MKIRFGLFLKSEGIGTEVLTGTGNYSPGSIQSVEWTRQDRRDLEGDLLDWLESYRPTIPGENGTRHTTGHREYYFEALDTPPAAA